MHLFESHILVEGSVEDCEQAWKNCIHGWLANESFLDIDSLDQERRETTESSFKWDLAANSSTNHKVICWQQHSALLETAGIIDFYDTAMPTERQTTTEVTLRVTVLNELKGITGFRIESQMGEVLYRNLRQFKHLVDTNKSYKQAKESRHAIA